MIDLSDTKIKTIGTKYRTLYRAHCDQCGADRGYMSKQNALKPLCGKCARSNCMTQEVRERMSKAKIGKTPHNKGKVVVSEESRKKMSSAKIGKPPSNKGKPLTEEQKIKISNTLTGREEFVGFKNTRYKRDINFRIKSVLRSRLSCAVLNNFKSGSAVRDLGCSIEELKIHLESKFQYGMSWQNYGRSSESWNIDHIVPLSSFDLSNPDEIKKACHYTNLQPMWAKDNIVKSNIIIPDRDLSGKTIFILCGPSGSGKTTLCNEFKINVVQYDKYKYGVLNQKFENINILETPVRANFLIDAFNKMNAIVVPIYLKISKDKIISNIANRNGVYKSIDRRIKRYEYLYKKGIFAFTGDFDQCKLFIANQIKTIDK